MLKVEATERWVGARLDALAASLHLACPVREAFLFDADHAFYTQCTESDVTLQRAAKRVFLHAGLPCDAVVVLWKTGLGAARLDRDGDSWFLELDATWKTNAHALGAIVAREVGLAVLAARNVRRLRTVVDEVHVDLVVMLTGLGSLLLHPLVANVTFGPLRPRLLRFAFGRVTTALRLPLPKSLDVVPRPYAIHHVLLWSRLSRTPLRFRALESHVIIRCFCMRRLRVPTGSEGTTTCPACKRKRPFDGRACAAAIIDTPVEMPPTPVPDASPVQRFGSALADISLTWRASMLVIVAMIVTIAVLNSY